MGKWKRPFGSIQPYICILALLFMIFIGWPFFLARGIEIDAVDAHGNEFLVYEYDGDIYHQANYKVWDEEEEEWDWDYYYGINDVKISSTTEDCIHPEIALDRDIHRVYLNNMLPEATGGNWNYIHVTYSMFDDTLSAYQVAYAKLRFTTLAGYDEDDVVLLNDVALKWDDTSAGRELNPTSVRIAMGYDNQPYIAYLVELELTESTYITAYYMKLDNNGYVLDTGHQLSVFPCKSITLSAEWNGGMGFEAVIVFTGSTVDELYRLSAY